MKMWVYVCIVFMVCSTCILKGIVHERKREREIERERKRSEKRVLLKSEKCNSTFGKNDIY